MVNSFFCLKHENNWVWWSKLVAACLTGFVVNNHQSAKIITYRSFLHEQLILFASQLFFRQNLSTNEIIFKIVTANENLAS